MFSMKNNEPDVIRKVDSRGRIFDSVLQAIGSTPLVRLQRVTKQAGVQADILVKCEFFNPLASVKDRVAFSMIETAEAEGRLSQGSVLVEPTSGNTGIALAFVCSAKGYPLILTMPEGMSIERRKMLLLLGAKLELTPAHLGMQGAIDRAEEIVKSNPNAIMLQQFENSANPQIHIRTTVEEIWQDTKGKVDVFISGIGTGGTITGVGTVLKKRNPNVRIIGVEPEDSPVLSGGMPGPHKIQGIGAGFVPKVLSRSVIDEIMTISSDTAFETTRKVAKMEGMPVGISSGATIAAALEVGARPEMQGKTIVVIAGSSAERYLSTELFSDITAL